MNETNTPQVGATEGNPAYGGNDALLAIRALISVDIIDTARLNS
jgi:hypothetical protein